MFLPQKPHLRWQEQHAGLGSDRTSHLQSRWTRDTNARIGAGQERGRAALAARTRRSDGNDSNVAFDPSGSCEPSDAGGLGQRAVGGLGDDFRQQDCAARRRLSVGQCLFTAGGSQVGFEFNF